eukprot:7384516-Prymnesium_polylepis.1
MALWGCTVQCEEPTTTNGRGSERLCVVGRSARETAGATCPRWMARPQARPRACAPSWSAQRMSARAVAHPDPRVFSRILYLGSRGAPPSRSRRVAQYGQGTGSDMATSAVACA